MATRSVTRPITLRLWLTIRMPSEKLLLEIGEQVEQLALHRDVEPGGRLVGDQEGRLGDQRAGDGDAARLAAADLVRKFLELRLGQAEPRHQVQHLRPALGLVHAVDDDRLGQQPADGEARRQRRQRVLEDHLHAPPAATAGRRASARSGRGPRPARVRSSGGSGRPAPWRASSCRCRSRRPGPSVSPTLEREADAGHRLHAAGEGDARDPRLRWCRASSHGTSQHAA